MKKLLIIILAFIATYSASAKVVGDTIYYNGKEYYIGPNMITNPSFSSGFTGWYDGTTTALPGKELTSTYWKVTKSGGVDGNWLMGITNNTKVHAGGLCTAWPIGHDSIFYFRFYISNRTKSTNPNVANYQMVSATNTIGTETKVLLGTGYKNSSNPLFGETTVASGDTAWTEISFVFDNSLEDRKYNFIQCCFRWEGPNLFGFDDFYLAPLIDATKVTEVQLVSMQFQSKVSELQRMEENATVAEYTGLAILIEDCLNECGAIDQSSIKAMKTSMNKIDSVMAVTTQGISDAKSLVALIATCQNVQNATAYPGAEAFGTAISNAQALIDNNTETTADQYSKGLASLTKALSDYRFSQSASDDAPANFTFMIKSPNFKIDDSQADSKTNLTSAGWVDGSTYKGNQQVPEYYTPYCSWKAWWSAPVTDTRYLDIHQTITGLPSGYYKISCLAKTQAGCISDQHAYAASAIETAVSPVMTNETDWDSLTTAKALVTDGKLVIGFTSSKKNANEAGYAADSREGWWKATHFKLYYTGPATEAEINQLLTDKMTSASAMADTMHFAGDKQALKDSIANNTGATGLDNVIKALSNINTALSNANKSEDKYASIYGTGKTIAVMTDSLSKASDAYGAANAIVKFACDKAVIYVSNATASYSKVDGLISKASRYYTNYKNAYNSANDSLTVLTSAKAKDLLSKTMAEQSATLTADTLLRTGLVDTLIIDLNKVVRTCYAQNLYEKNSGTSDYTFMIQNPDAGGTVNKTTGWTLDKGTGDNTTAVGQHYNGTTFRYFNAYNGTKGALNYFGSQDIDGIPNGTYSMKVACRTSADKGTFLFASNGGTAKTDTIWKRIDMTTYTEKNYKGDGTDTTYFVTSTRGGIWEAANAAVLANSYTELQFNQSLVNSSTGYGWFWVTLDNIVVDNHKMAIGMTTDSLRTGEPFTGTWFSVVDFSLVKTADGDNADWNGPITGINNVTTTEKLNATEGIYNLSGVKMNSNAQLPKGIYIIKQAGATKKILVK